MVHNTAINTAYLLLIGPVIFTAQTKCSLPLVPRKIKNVRVVAFTSTMVSFFLMFDFGMSLYSLHGLTTQVGGMQYGALLA